jgi:hypothetical protein
VKCTEDPEVRARIGCVKLRPDREQLRRWLPAAVVVIGLAATVWVIIWIHSAARSSPDSWATSVAAVTTAALALITLWYAYLTFKLLEAQRSAPRTAAWETALRDLSLYMAQKHDVMWKAEQCFPGDDPDYMPLPLLEMFARRDGMTELCDHLLNVMGLLPTSFQKQILGVTIDLVEAHTEIHALAAAMTEAQTLRMEQGHKDWSWDDVQQAHEASEDSERAEPWADLINGRRFHAAQEAWDQLSTDVDKYIRT